jgi:two-component system, NtrC family, sensor kinase
MLASMEPTSDLLLSTLLTLPDDQRAELERELVPLARAAALGELAADVAHDVANPLFGVMGLVDLLLEDVPPGSDLAARVELVQRSTLEIRRTVQGLLDFARLGADDSGSALLPGAAEEATRLYRHGARKSVALEERYQGETVSVRCRPAELVQAIFQLLLAAPTEGGIVLDVDGPVVRVAPAPARTLGTVVAERIVTDSGGVVERDDAAVTFRWTG